MDLPSNRRNIIAVGASAGGVQALTQLCSMLPGNLPGAVLIVMHIASHSPSSLHNVIRRATTLRVVPAEDGTSLDAGTIYVAVADKHLTVDNDRLRLTRGPRECRSRPSIDALFRSAAVNCGPRVIGVVMSGTLDDGTGGLWAVKDRGGLAMVQDPSEAEYPSMPASAIEHVQTDFVGTAASLAGRIIEHCGQPIAEVLGSRPSRMVVENAIACEANGMESGAMELGTVSRYTCPECHGVLVQIDEGSIVRFRCHTGHAFSIKTLMAELNVAIDHGLWDTLRVIEEKVMLLKQAATRAQDSGNVEAANQYQQLIDATKESLAPLRALVKSWALFDGSEPIQPRPGNT